MTPLAIDFNALRIGLIATMRAAMLLTQEQVIMAEPEVADAPRPALPYFDIKMSTPSTMYGRDVEQVISAGENGQGKNLYVSQIQGPRGVGVTFMSFARTHEEANGMMVTWQTLLGSAAVREQLHAVGLSAWTYANVEDKSALLDTGYEGRCSLTVTFGTVALITSQPSTGGVIDSATVQGTTTGGTLTAEASD